MAGGDRPEQRCSGSSTAAVGGGAGDRPRAGHVREGGSRHGAAPLHRGGLLKENGASLGRGWGRGRPVYDSTPTKARSSGEVLARQASCQLPWTRAETKAHWGQHSLEGMGPHKPHCPRGHAGTGSGGQYRDRPQAATKALCTGSKHWLRGPGRGPSASTPRVGTPLPVPAPSGRLHHSPASY